jgi:hypothetical protein
VRCFLWSNSDQQQSKPTTHDIQQQHCPVSAGHRFRGVGGVSLEVRNQDGRSQVSPQVSLSSHCHEHLPLRAHCVRPTQQTAIENSPQIVCVPFTTTSHTTLCVGGCPAHVASAPMHNAAAVRSSTAWPSREDKSASPDARPFTAPQRCRLQLSGQAQIHSFPVKLSACDTGSLLRLIWPSCGHACVAASWPSLFRSVSTRLVSLSLLMSGWTQQAAC